MTPQFRAPFWIRDTCRVVPVSDKLSSLGVFADGDHGYTLHAQQHAAAFMSVLGILPSLLR